MNAPLVQRLRNLDPQILWGPALAVGAAILYQFDPHSFNIGQCPFHQFTGYHCPGCGTLRAAHSLLHGQIGVALGFNPLMVLSLPFLAAMYSARVFRLVGRARPPSWITTRRITTAIPWIVIGYWLLRNLPFYPFSLLSP